MAFPRTPDEAVALVQAAYGEVKRDWEALPARPVSDTDQLNGTAAPAPYVVKLDAVPPDPTWHFVGAAAALLVSLLPFSLMTVIRWIITSRWHLGPRW